jgi:hypothetical protein
MSSVSTNNTFGFPFSAAPSDDVLLDAEPVEGFEPPLEHEEANSRAATSTAEQPTSERRGTSSIDTDRRDNRRGDMGFRLHETEDIVAQVVHRARLTSVQRHRQ